MARYYHARKDPDPLVGGRYKAELITIEERDSKYGGSYLTWTFKVYHNGTTHAVEGATGDSFTSRTREFAWVTALQGRPLGDGEGFSLETLYGHTCEVEVIVKELEYGVLNKVVKVFPAPRSEDAEVETETDDVPF
jgi:hypothetical protein